MKRYWIALLSLLMALLLLASCTGTGMPQETETEKTPVECKATLNGVKLDAYTIVHASDALDYTVRAASYIRDAIEAETGVELTVATDESEATAHEILVGETARPLSKTLDADTEGVQFALLAGEGSVAMEADYFVIAAAAYYFTESYITGEEFDAEIASEVAVCEPITEAPNNYLFLIGDGMGVYQTKLFDYLETPENVKTDGEDLFYGYLLPYQGMARTDSLSGVTDSAAAGTALATGYKTLNSHIGKDKDLKDVMSLTELASSLGKATAVLSTEVITGATPAAFSAHADSRKDTAAIRESQKLMTSTILLSCSDSYDDYIQSKKITDTLAELEQDTDGFFVMYEEAYIDKNCHDNDFEKTYKALLRFNQSIGRFMEYAFYHPDTFVLITADHETGALSPDGQGGLKYNSEDHSGSDVCVFAYGMGAEVFHDRTVENVQIPKTIAKMWGKADFGDPISGFDALN